MSEAPSELIDINIVELKMEQEHQSDEGESGREHQEHEGLESFDQGNDKVFFALFRKGGTIQEG